MTLVPEGVVSELAAVLRADMDEFEKDVDIAKKHLEELKEEQTELGVETGETEAGLGDLIIESQLLKNVLATLFEAVKENSGGLAALTDMAMGYIGAGIDTFIAKVLMPAWEGLTEVIDEVVLSEGDQKKSIDDVIETLNLYKTPLGDYVASTEDAAEADWEFVASLKDANYFLDEHRNMLVTTGAGVLIFDGQTGDLLGTFEDLDLGILNTEAGLGVLSDKVREVADETGIAYDDLFFYVTEGMSDVRNILKTWPEGTAVYQIAEAADEVWERLATNLVRLGVDPNTGEDITGGQRIEAQLWGAGAWNDPTVLTDYLLHGGG